MLIKSEISPEICRKVFKKWLFVNKNPMHSVLEINLDFLKTKINKKSVFELAKNLCIRLFIIDEENLSGQDEEATEE